MSLITWNSDYELGIPGIDAQHKKFVEILNTFYDQLAASDIESKTKTLLDEVLDYTLYHFIEEERFMTKMGYEKLEEHKRLHEEIRGKIQAFRTSMDEGKLVMSMKITSELKDWIKNHILIEDKKYAEKYLQTQQ
ncbi:bacteriohemerythrin [Sediminispirochaeta smaragdinae]|jgi:hemerythrin-like metal-binding protein|uniref:Hemerythrin-like metal-binding protein n=1 Tax=Sediminispirochaeta smaragdinae (strain DSM 11293 / JCM 15392 / SEBR 4228) TaxID=573413 RepID=E1R8B7_SEDSS|nr:bacteriohemerythrin [Sediminispirochaeta smaragdinae]ADK79261.1 hemerythrin-like metal-binding protein [Sediminispirochaeta smaragdinae DSM 11293]